MFWLRSVEFLGHIIFIDGVEVDHNRIEPVKNWPRPFANTDIRSFLGLARYYMRFGDCFASIASPLTTLTLKNMKFEWSEAFKRSFQFLKVSLTTTLALTLLEGTKGFLVNCNSSRMVLICVLL